MIKNSAEHEAYKQDVVKKAELEATARFEAMIPTIRDNPQAGVNALADIAATRALTPCEKRIMVGLIQLEGCRVALSHFKPHSKV